MQGSRALWWLALMAWLAACAPAVPTAAPLPPLASPRPSATLTAPTAPATPSALLPTLTPPPAPTATPSATPRSPEAARLQLGCWGVLTERPADLVAAGTLLFADVTNEAVYVDAATNEPGVMNALHESRFSFAVSPDRQWVAYRRVLRDPMRIQTLDDSLVIADAADRPLSVRPWEHGWASLAGWLDNTRVIINVSARYGEEALAKKPATLAVLNTATGRLRELSPTLPNVSSEYPVPNWDGWGVTAYDSTLTRVVYLFDAASGLGGGYRLWDLAGQQALAHVPSTMRTHVPRWAPDGERFVVAAASEGGENWLQFELYSAGRDGGEAERLTYLTEYYTAVYIQSYSWSPAGDQLAFWLVADPQGVPFIEHGEAHLALLDTATGTVTNTCLPGDHDASVGPARVPPPLWSPDGTQLLIENSAAVGASRSLLVDVASQAAVEVARGLRPEGWLVTVP